MYVKFGQMLSNRKDILPEEMIIELQKLQDDVEVEKVDVRNKMNLELGIEIDDYFEEIEEEPMASASIGQVFKGRLKNEEKVHFIGMIFLLVLMLIIVFFDVTKYF